MHHKLEVGTLLGLTAANSQGLQLWMQRAHAAP